MRTKITSWRHFTAPVEEIDGTVDSVSPGGITLKEFPGRKFQFSSVGMSAADMSARIIGEQNKLTRAEAAKEVDRRRGDLRQYLADTLSGESVHLVVPKGAAENAENIRAVVMAGGTNVNQVFPSCPTTKTRACAGGNPAGFSVSGPLGQDRLVRGDRFSDFVSGHRGEPVPPKRVLIFTLGCTIICAIKAVCVAHFRRNSVRNGLLQSFSVAHAVPYAAAKALGELAIKSYTKKTGRPSRDR